MSKDRARLLEQNRIDSLNARSRALIESLKNTPVTNTAAGIGTGSGGAYIDEALKPAADFIGSRVSGLAPFLVEFTDLSNNSPTSWLWEFGTGDTSTEKNPNYEYSTPGTYNVKLTASNSENSVSVIKQSYITVFQPLVPVADFFGSPVSGAAPLSVTFTDSSTNFPTSWEWDFENTGSVNSTEQNPTYEYPNVGTYSVKLTVTNALGSDTITKTSYITTSEPFAAGFTSMWKLSLEQLTVTLPYEPGGAYAGTIDWGDGTTSANSYGTHEHTYLVPGDYTITVNGTINGFSFNGGASASQISDISKWGGIIFGNNGGYFNGCINLSISATDSPDFTGTTTFYKMFSDCIRITSIPGISGWDTSLITDMSRMFYGASSFNDDLSAWNVQSVTDMNAMFQNAVSFNSSVPVNTSSVSNMGYMFSGAINFTGLNVVDMNVGNVTDMSYMFSGATLFDGDISTWDTGKVINMSHLFEGTSSILNKISNLNISSVTDMSSMFAGNTVFNQDLANWATYINGVTNMDNMFDGCDAFNQDISGWQLGSKLGSAVNFMRGKSTADYSYLDNIYTTWYTWVHDNSPISNLVIDFGSIQYTPGGDAETARNGLIQGFSWTITDGGPAASLDSFISRWRTGDSSEYVSLPYLKSGTYSGTIDWGDGSSSDNTYGTRTHIYDVPGDYIITITGTISGFNFSEGAGQNNMFKIQEIIQWGALDLGTGSGSGYFTNCSNLVITATDALHLASITDISRMFQGCTSLTDLGTSTWDTGHIENMSHLFDNATSFNGDLSTWDVRSVIDMSYMFNGATSFNGDISSWQTGVVCNNMSYMFAGATSFNQDISILDTSAVQYMSHMFAGATSFVKGGPLNTISVTDMTSMFDGATSFTGEDVSSMVVDNVIYMYRMFYGATSFDGDMSSWKTSLVTDMGSMFQNTTSNLRGVENFDIRSVTSMPYMFAGNTTFNQDIGRSKSWPFFDSVVNIDYMFDGCIGFNQDISSWQIRSLQSAVGFMNGKSTVDYSYLDNIYINWSEYVDNNRGPSSVTIDFGNIEYTDAGLIRQGRDLLTNNYSWTITDGGGIIPPTPTNRFISTWRTTSLSQIIELPYVASGFYSGTIDWGDGSASPNALSSRFHTYATPGDYTIIIDGTISGFSFAGNGASSQEILNISQWGNINLASEAGDTGYFSGCTNLTISAIDSLDLTNITSFASMFAECTSLTNVPGISTWVTSYVTDMSNMFNRATNFNDNLSAWNTLRVTDMSGMFKSATSFTSDLRSWNTGSVTTFDSIFANAISFNSNLNDWDTSSASNMSGMFAGAASFNSSLNKWNTFNVTTMSYMFADATDFNGDLSGWDISNVINMASMFRNTTSALSGISSWQLTARPEFAENNTNMSYMFAGNTVFNQAISSNSWREFLTSVVNMDHMFDGCTGFNQDISSWQVPSLLSAIGFMNGKSTADYSHLDNIYEAWYLSTDQNYRPFDVVIDFGNIKYSIVKSSKLKLISDYSWIITDGGLADQPVPLTAFISTWRTTTSNETITLPYSQSGVYTGTIDWGDGSTSDNVYTNRIHTYDAPGDYTIIIDGDINSFSFGSFPDSKLSILNISQWGNINLEFKSTGAGYFNGCANLIITATDSLDLTHVSSFFKMFKDCISLTSIPGISDWNTSSIIDMSGMFAGASSFNGDLSLWNTSGVTDMSAMFTGAISFNSDLSLWNTSSVTNMYAMFRSATGFTSDLSLWNTSFVTDMSYMFSGATGFNGDISNWNVSNVYTMDSMFQNTTAELTGINTWIFGDFTEIMQSMFAGNTVFNTPLNASEGWSRGISSVKRVDYMFAGCTSFNQDISSWLIRSLSSAIGFMDGKSTADYSYLDNIYNNWYKLLSKRPIYDLVIDFGSIQYTAAGAGNRSRFVGIMRWVITDGGLI